MNSVSPYLAPEPKNFGTLSNRPNTLQQPTYVQSVQQVPLQTVQLVPLQNIQPVQVKSVPVQVQSVPVQYTQPINQNPIVPPQDSELYQQEEQEQYEQVESNFETTPIPEKKNKCFDWLLYLWLISFLITALILSSNLVRRTSQNIKMPNEALGMAERVVENLRAQPIADIIFVLDQQGDINNVLNPLMKIVNDRKQTIVNREKDVFQNIRPKGNIDDVLNPLTKIPKGIAEQIASNLPATLQNVRQNPQNNLASTIANRNEKAIRNAMGSGVSENSGSPRHKEENICPNGFVEIPVGQFKGVQSGCLCGQGKIELGVSCMFKTGCRRVNSIDETPLKLWNHHRACAKFTKDYSYSDQCTTQQQRCSPGLCVSLTENCPLTKLEQTTEVEGDTTQIKLRDGVFLKKSQKSTEQPLIGLSITPGIASNSPCFNEKIAPKFESGKYYPLFIQPQKGCQSLEEYAYHTTIDSQPEMKVYEENKLQQQLEALPEWNDYYSPADTFHLQSTQRVRLGTSEQCTKVNYKMIEQSRQNSVKLYYIAQSLGIFGIIIASLGLTFAIVGFFLKSKMGLKQSRLLFLITLILAIVTIILAIVYNYQYKKQGGIQDTHNKLQQFVKAQCFYDPPLLKMIQDIDDFGSNIQKAVYFYVQFFLWVSIIFILLAFGLSYLENLQYGEFCLDPWSQLKQ